MNNMNNYGGYSKEDRQIIKLIESLKSPIKESDEYNTFCTMLKNINSLNPKLIDDFVNILNDSQKFMWKELIHTRRIEVNCSGEKINVPRRTVKIKREGN